MKSKIITFPFVEIHLTGNTKSANTFFSQQFFNLPNTTDALFQIHLHCEPIQLGSAFVSAGGDVIRQGNTCYLRDSRGKLSQIDFDQVSKTDWKARIDPEFDWYYFYTFVLESLMIVVLADHQIGFLHASALVNHKQESVIFSAWQHTGKTHLLLNLSQKGWGFMSDDYCVVKDQIVYAFPKKINLFSYNFAQFPDIFVHLALSVKMKLKASMAIKTLLERLSKVFSGPLAKVFYRLSELAEVASNIKLSPDEIDMNVISSASFSNLFILQRSNGNPTTISKGDQDQVTQQMEKIMMYEQREFLHLYQKYQFLFPDRSVEIIEAFPNNYKKFALKITKSVKVVNLDEDISPLLIKLYESVRIR